MARAASVATLLFSRTPIQAKRVSTMRFGEHRPLVANDTASGRQKNRRVEIILTNFYDQKGYRSYR